MLIVPGLPPMQNTRHSRELGRKVEQLVRDYQREHPDVTEGDVRTALAQLTQSGDSPGVVQRKRVLVIAIAVLTAGAFAAMASSGGGRFENTNTVWMIVGVVAGACGVAIAAIRIARRG